MAAPKSRPAQQRAFQGVLRSLIESEKLARVSYHAEALYFRLLLASDGHGRFHGHALDVAVRADPRRVRAGAVDVAQVEAALAELQAAGLLSRYEADESVYLELTDYWQPSKADRPSRSEHPGPERHQGALHASPAIDGGAR